LTKCVKCGLTLPEGQKGKCWNCKLIDKRKTPEFAAARSDSMRAYWRKRKQAGKTK